MTTAAMMMMMTLMMMTLMMMKDNEAFRRIGNDATTKTFALFTPHLNMYFM